jgi:hypothetical protein
MRIGVWREDHPEVRAIIASEHCVQRFRRRRRIRTPGVEAVASELGQAFEEADITRWAPSWVDSDRKPQLWALVDDMAFPLVAAGSDGEWLAATCLVRGRR